MQPFCVSRYYYSLEFFLYLLFFGDLFSAGKKGYVSPDKMEISRSAD